MRDCTKSGTSGRGAFSQTTPRVPDQPNDRSRCQDVGEALKVPPIVWSGSNRGLGNHQTSACRVVVKAAGRLRAFPGPPAVSWGLARYPRYCISRWGYLEFETPVIAMLTLGVKIHALFHAVVQFPIIVAVEFNSPGALACGRCQYSVPSAAKPSGKHGAVTGGVEVSPAREVRDVQQPRTPRPAVCVNPTGSTNYQTRFRYNWVWPCLRIVS
jgi:hypothetical protein